jgi:hypothetical protein
MKPQPIRPMFKGFVTIFLSMLKPEFRVCHMVELTARGARLRLTAKHG